MSSFHFVQLICPALWTYDWCRRLTWRMSGCRRGVRRVGERGGGLQGTRGPTSVTPCEHITYELTRHPSNNFKDILSTPNIEKLHRNVNTDDELHYFELYIHHFDPKRFIRLYKHKLFSYVFDTRVARRVLRGSTSNTNWSGSTFTCSIKLLPTNCPYRQ